MTEPIINNNQPGSITEAYPAPSIVTVIPAATVETALTEVDIKKIFSNETKKLTLFIPLILLVILKI